MTVKRVIAIGLITMSSAAIAAPKPPATAASPARVQATKSPGCTTTMSHSDDNRVAYFRHCPDSPEMVAFRGGGYKMGDAVGRGHGYELPVHEVTIAPFAVGRYEVTRAEWQACVAAGGCSEPSKTPAGEEAGGRYPVTSVTWNQAKAYVAWLAMHTGQAYRLPSEAEWEYAARAGSVGDYTWNWDAPVQLTCKNANVFDRTGYGRHPELGWFVSCDDGYGETAPVGSFLPNAWGVYDMLGNVWEWVEDCWHPDYTGAPANGSAWITGGVCRKRVNRGGGWGNGTGALRLSSRDADLADVTSDGLGFRVALSIAMPRAAPPTTAPATQPVTPAPAATPPAPPVAPSPASATPAAQR